MKITDAEAKLPPCPRRCSVCAKSPPTQHHWMWDFEEPTEEQEKDPNFEPAPKLICRHCDAEIKDPDINDPNCPDV